MSIAPNNIPGADWSRYSNPFLTPSSDGFPTRLETALDLAEFLFFFHPEYASATARLVSHFCTGLDWKGQVGGVGEREELANLLFDKLDLRGHMRQLGMNWGCFGNGMAVVHQPFDRFLIDTRGARLKTWDLSMFQDLEGVQYNWDKMTYTVPDPLKMRQESHKLHTAGNAVPTVEFEIYDQASRDVSRLAIRQLDPRTLVLDEAISGKLVVYDRFSVDFRQQIKSNQLHQISQTPIAILRAVQQDKYLRYSDGEVFHLKEPTIAGLSNRGWGLSPVLRNYRAIQQLSVYRKIDEVVGREYMLPFRVITPGFGPDMDEGAIRTAMHRWTPQLRQMVEGRRKNEQLMHTLPFPVVYQEFGASGKQLSTKDHLEFQQDTMLNAAGFPAEIYRGTMAIQTLPTALRMLEANFHFLFRGFDQFSKWVTHKVQEFRQQDYIEPTLQPPRVADDIEQRQVWLQMSAGGEIPRRIAYTPFNIDNPVEAAKERMREDMDIARAQQELQEQEQRRQSIGSGTALVGAAMQGAAQAGQAAQPGGAGRMPPPGPVTPVQQQQDAQAKAMELLNMEEGPRRVEMRNIEASNANFYAVVKDQMDRQRRKGESAGRAQAGQM